MSGLVHFRTSVTLRKVRVGLGLVRVRVTEVQKWTTPDNVCLVSSWEASLGLDL